jgi:hypothetical protein
MTHPFARLSGMRAFAFVRRPESADCRLFNAPATGAMTEADSTKTLNGVSLAGALTAPAKEISCLSFHDVVS